MATTTDQAIRPDTRRPTHLVLTLSDFSVIEQFEGIYVSGLRAVKQEPRTRVIVKARRQYKFASDKLILGESEVEDGTINFLPCNSKEESEQSYISYFTSELVLYILENVFTALKDAIQRNDIESASVVMSAEPDENIQEKLRLVFGTLSVEHRKQAKPLEPRHDAGEARRERFYWAIIILLGLILIQLWHR